MRDPRLNPVGASASRQLFASSSDQRFRRRGSTWSRASVIGERARLVRGCACSLRPALHPLEGLVHGLALQLADARLGHPWAYVLPNREREGAAAVDSI